MSMFLLCCFSVFFDSQKNIRNVTHKATFMQLPRPASEDAQDIAVQLKFFYFICLSIFYLRIERII